jgi:uncharacterized protein YndB with AHSA1/START domain
VPRLLDRGLIKSSLSQKYMNENFNHNSFIRKIYINKNINEVYKMIVLPERISKWFIDKAEYTSAQKTFRNENEEARQGDKYKWLWNYKNFSTEGEILESEKDKIFKFTFGSAGIVTITLKEGEKNKTLVELKQENFPGEKYDEYAYINCYVCWTFYLLNLKSVMEKAFDLRDRDTNYMDGFVNK